MTSIKRLTISLFGTVQGVGFRPFVYRIACENNLTGFVKNRGGIVKIEAQGSAENLNNFTRELKEKPPKASNIVHAESAEIAIIEDELSFEIIKSESAENSFTPPSDIAMCERCRRELFDKNNHRYRYPFINCTECGSRLTIIKSAPYDRAQTTMAGFAMCDDCKREYENPLNRRYHAEPIACEKCGPSCFCDGFSGEAAISRAVETLKQGKIVAIKGIGGYHLCCKVERGVIGDLREKKGRDAKPFALMARNTATVQKYLKVSDAERKMLESAAAPITILAQNEHNFFRDLLSADTDTVGVMLPYTPLHTLIMEEFDFLVVTSGNFGGEAIIFDDESAKNAFLSVADTILSHNRPIFAPIDDSVARIFEGTPQIIRRARGFSPKPLIYEEIGSNSPTILAAGAQMKSAFAINRGNELFLSQHIGELENVLEAYTREIERYKLMLGVEPEAVAIDLHPTYSYREYFENLGLKTVEIQHHRAHIASCFVENRLKLDEKVIGIALDGLGFGDDGTLWGGEIFSGNIWDLTRVAHLTPITLPRGESAKYPYISALSVGTDGAMFASDERIAANIPLVQGVIESHVNTIKCTSAGRLFDAAAAILGLKNIASFDGEAGMALETRAKHAPDKSVDTYAVSLENREDGLIEMCHRSIFEEIFADLARSECIENIAFKFHVSLAKLVTLGAVAAREKSGINIVLLSGGVFQNTLLLGLIVENLRKLNFVVHTHGDTVPTNDGGIALGQLLILRGYRVQTFIKV